MLSRILKRAGISARVPIARALSTQTSPYHPLAAQVEVGQLLGSKAGGGGISHKILTVPEGAPVLDAVKAMVSNHHGSVLITDGERVSGIFTERDYLQKLKLQGKSSEDTPCRDVMTKKPFCVTPQNSLDDCIRFMVEARARHLPVVNYVPKESGQDPATSDLVGMLSVRDVISMLHLLGASPQWQKLSQLTVRETLAHAHAGDAVYSIKSDATVLEAIHQMAKCGCGCLIVNEGNEMTGIVTERDYLTKVKVKGKDADSTFVSEIMTSPPECISPEYTLDQAMEIFKLRNFRHLPVVETDSADSHSSCVDLLSVTDVLAACGMTETH